MLVLQLIYSFELRGSLIAARLPIALRRLFVRRASMAHHGALKWRIQPLDMEKEEGGRFDWVT